MPNATAMPSTSMQVPLLNADGATAWRVLTDYNRYPEFIPDLR